MTQERSKKFIEHLYQEKELHKEHRNRHVIYKLVLSSSFFGLGQFGGSYKDLLPLFLYIVPFVALVHDIYVFAEDFKVKRVGLFLRRFDNNSDSPVCAEEIEWEKYVKRHREKWATRASFAYTVIITFFSASAIALIEGQTQFPHLVIYALWLLLCVIGIAVVFSFARTLRKRIVKIEIEEKLRNGDT